MIFKVLSIGKLPCFGIASRICVPCGLAADLVTFAAEQRTPITGSVPTLNETSFVNAYAGGGANVENIPLIQREQIQRAANKWNV